MMMTLPTPYWQSEDGRATLYCGDCLELLPLMASGSVDAVVTDPPYSSGGMVRGDRTNGTVTKYLRTNTEQYEKSPLPEFTGDNRDQRAFLAWCSLWLCAARHASTTGAVVCCFTDWRQLPTMTDAIQCGGWVWRNIATWWKPGVRMQRGRFSSSAEFVIYGTNGPHESDGEYSPQNVIACQPAASEDKEHIAEKPEEVMGWILGVTRPGAVVLDPFAGSGTTGVACIQTGRKFIGIELSEKYCAIAARRLAAACCEDGGLFDPKAKHRASLFSEAV